MNRRKFIESTGIIITASALMSMRYKNEIDRTNYSKNVEKKEGERDLYEDVSIPILKAITIGINAPSAHNTQAWKFKIINNLEALFYVDETKLLPKTDPPSRQIHISCGCFLEALAIGCTGIGYEAKLTLLPEGEYDVNDIGKKPVASIKLNRLDTISKHELFEFIFIRRTNRTTYTGDLITVEEFDKIKSNCSTLHSKVSFINEAEEIEKYKFLFSEAMRTEFNTIETNEETRRMFRFHTDESVTKRDGLTFEANGLSGISLYLARTFTKNTLESWNNKMTIEKGLSNFNKGSDSSKAFIFWTTPTNNIADQINVGRDFYQFILSLTKNGLYCHPLNQVIQEYSEMETIRKEFEILTKTNDKEKVQMIVRIGKSKTPFKSYRRHLDKFIINKI